MPNWCSCALIVVGDDVAEFRATMEGGAFRMQQTVPCPPELDDVHNGVVTIDGVKYERWREVDGRAVPVTDEEQAGSFIAHGARDWYEWKRANWGTKWDAVNAKIMEDGAVRVRIAFDTAWSPPIAWLEKASALFPTLRFTLAFAERGREFWGVCESQGGLIVRHDESGDFYSEFTEDEGGVLMPEVKAHLQRYGLHEGG